MSSQPDFDGDGFHERLAAALEHAVQQNGGRGAGGGAATQQADPEHDEFSDRLANSLRSTQHDDEHPEAAESAEQDTQSESSGPVGDGDHEVRQGECISSIARESGHFWETIWNDGGNEELRRVRENPNVLLPGDRVTVPELRSKTEAIEAETRHHFRRRGEPTLFRLRILANDRPRANQPYTAEVGGTEQTGTTDGDGNLQFPIPANASTGRLRVGRDAGEREYQLRFRRLNPVAEVTGVQQRLENLGFACGPADGELGPRTRAALRHFQSKHELTETGEPDSETQDRLREEHGT